MDLLIEKLKRIYRKLFKNPPNYTITINVIQERHGSIYGGWNIEKDSLNNDSIVYSVGIGEDISFDLSLIKKYHCKVYGFDPTDRVVEWLNKQKLPEEFVFEPIALSDKDGYLTFFSPEKEDDISHKAISGKGSKAIQVKCKKISTLMRERGHVFIDILKIDIEGFEYDVIENIISENIRPKQLLIEFHHFFPEFGNKKTEQMISTLERNGFRLFNVADSFCEYSFIYES
jgi:FkbM family methyltransferase